MVLSTGWSASTVGGPSYLCLPPIQVNSTTFIDLASRRPHLVQVSLKGHQPKPQGKFVNPRLHARPLGFANDRSVYRAIMACRWLLAGRPQFQRGAQLAPSDPAHARPKPGLINQLPTPIFCHDPSIARPRPCTSAPLAHNRPGVA